MPVWRSREFICLGPSNIWEERDEDTGPFHIEAGISLRKFGMKYPRQRGPQPPKRQYQEEVGGQIPVTWLTLMIRVPGSVV